MALVPPDMPGHNVSLQLLTIHQALSPGASPWMLVPQVWARHRFPGLIYVSSTNSLHPDTFVKCVQ